MLIPLTSNVLRIYVSRIFSTTNPAISQKAIDICKSDTRDVLARARSSQGLIAFYKYNTLATWIFDIDPNVVAAAAAASLEESV